MEYPKRRLCKIYYFPPEKPYSISITDIEQKSIRQLSRDRKKQKQGYNKPIRLLYDMMNEESEESSFVETKNNYFLFEEQLDNISDKNELIDDNIMSGSNLSACPIREKPDIVDPAKYLKISYLLNPITA